MSQFLHHDCDNDGTKAMAILQVFSENSQAKNKTYPDRQTNWYERRWCSESSAVAHVSDQLGRYQNQETLLIAQTGELSM